MNIRYLKSHNGFDPGDTDEVTEERGNYFIRCKVAEEISEDDEPDQPKKRGRKPKS